ncbi:hypothetical protein LCGC14_0302730 [marine sediment metagenome]|uniref:Uncharacterized protein n=1 Tax=marine sediment metagenome TaxID=412755 RepID=A0A0F9WB80_9ZZZZ
MPKKRGDPRRMVKGLPRRKLKQSKTVNREILAKEIFRNSKLLASSYEYFNKRVYDDSVSIFDHLPEVERDFLLDVAQSILNRFNIEDDWHPDKTVESNLTGGYKIYAPKLPEDDSTSKTINNI